MKTLRYKLIPLAVVTAFSTGTARADDSLAGTPYIAPMGSYVLADKSRDKKNAFGGTLAIGAYFSKGWEFELLGNYLNYGGKTTQTPGLLGLGSTTVKSSATTIYAGGIGLNAHLFKPETYASGLFLHIDAMGGSTILMDAGLGYDIPLGYSFGGVIPSGLAIRLEALYHLDPGHKDSNGRDRSFNEAQFNVGLRIPLGSPPRPAPEPTPEPVAVVPVQQPAPPPPPPPPPPCQSPTAGEPIDLAGCKTGDTIVLHGVNFNFNKSTLTVNAKSLLDQVVDALNKRPDIKVEIDGYTDSIGSDAYNQKLSEHRAASVKAYLVQKGIAASRMSTKGFGESNPVASNKTDDGRELNRRVELKITDSKPADTSAPAPAPASASTSEAPAADSMQGSSAPAEAAPAKPSPEAPAADTAPQASAATDTPSSTPPAPYIAGSAVTVSIHDYLFSPQAMTIDPGTTVTWNNSDATTHSVEFDDASSGDIDMLRGTYSRTFTKPGTYHYHCKYHPYMKGTIVVKGTSTSSATPAATGPAAAPSDSLESILPRDSASDPAPSTQAGTDPAPAAAANDGTPVTIQSYQFTPATVTVAPGGTVTWTNTDGVTHSVKFGDQVSPDIDPKGTYSRTFSQPGIYPYHCGVHEYMKGTVVVKAP